MRYDNATRLLYVPPYRFKTERNRMHYWPLAAQALLILTATSVHAQVKGNSAAVPAELSAPNACKQKVAEFERAIGLIRQTQGNKAAAELKEKLMPAKVQNDILFKEGYCGLARYIREKRLDR